jgi:hypothetical protein
VFEGQSILRPEIQNLLSEMGIPSSEM